MSLLARVRNAFKREPTPTGRRRFEAAAINRLTAGWQTESASLNDDILHSLGRLRARSRDLRKNNEYAAKYVRMVSDNVIGAQGVLFQSAVVDPDGRPDMGARKVIDDAWYKQARRGNWEVTGQHDMASFLRQEMETLATDGEFLWRKVRGPGYGHFGFQLQALDPARLDETYNVTATPGRNAIIMGVEVDSFRRPVAYHILTSASGSRERDRVPAEEIIHRFIAIGPEQVRGVPWMHAGMKLVHDLGGYREAAVIAARVGACKMGFYTTKEGSEPDGLPGGGDATGKHDFPHRAEPGEFDVLPDGYDFQTYDPTYPHEQFGAFTKAGLRGIASAWGVSYDALASDLEAVNFSSMRSGKQEERDRWMTIQDWLIETTLRDLAEEFISWALLGGKLLTPKGKALPAARADKFIAHTWQPRRWAWVDPKKDIEASVLAIDNLLASPQQVAAQQGRDVMDVLDDLKRFKEALAERGLQQPAHKPAPHTTTEDEEDNA